MWPIKAIHSAKPQLLPQLMDYASVAPEAVALGCVRFRNRSSNER